MPKYPKLLTTLACLILVGTLVGILSRREEPYYQGRSFSEWLGNWEHNVLAGNSDFHTAENAIHRIGTNAIPTMIEWICEDPAPWQKNARRKLPPRVWTQGPGKFLFGLAPEEHSGRALLAFFILGTNASPALPELEVLMRDPVRPAVASRVIRALSCLGAPAVKPLAAALIDTKQPCRNQIALSLGGEWCGQVATNITLPALQAAVNDPDPLVRDAASMAMKTIASAGVTNVTAE
jgi:hypothetical protein